MSKPIANTPLAQFLYDYIYNELGINQHKFAKKIGLSQSQVARIICGEGNPLGPKGKVRELLAAELGYSIAEFEKKFSLSHNTESSDESILSSIKIRSFVELVEMNKKGNHEGLAEDEIIKQIKNNDLNNYPEVYSNPYLIDRIVEKDGRFDWGCFMKQNSGYCKLLVNYNNTSPEIIGDWQYAPIKEDEFQKLKGDPKNNVLPTITETDLDDNNLPSLQKPGFYHIFLLNYSINPLFYDQSINMPFMQEFIKEIRKNEKFGIFIKDILCRPCNSIYQNLLRDYGFEILEYTAISEENGSINSSGKYPLYYLNDLSKLTEVFN